MKLKSKGKPYWERPDIGIGGDDIEVQGNTIRVKVHSLGSVDAPASIITIKDANGKTISTAAVPALKAPLDFIPKTADVILTVPAGTDLSECSVQLDPDRKITEITKRNNTLIIQ